MFFVLAEELIVDEIIFKMIRTEINCFLSYLGISVFITLCHFPTQCSGYVY